MGKIFYSSEIELVRIRPITSLSSIGSDCSETDFFAIVTTHCVATTAILANKELFLGRFLLLDFQFARISKRDTVSRLMFLLVAISGDRNRPAYREFRTGKYVLCVNWEDSVQGQGNRSLSLTIASCYILLRTAVYYFICIR